MDLRLGIVTCLAACWSSTEPARVTEPIQPAPPAHEAQRRGTLRIDARPGGKKFQGVWLELADGTRWVIDYRPRALWTAFADTEVWVRGACYVPFGQAINAPHFRVDHLRPVTVERGRGPYLEIGPETVLRGTFGEVESPAGSKRAGDKQLQFTDDGGTAHWITSELDPRPAPGTAAKVTARVLVPDMSYTAQAAGSLLWIAEVRDPAAVDDDAHAPKIVPCP